MESQAGTKTEPKGSQGELRGAKGEPTRATNRSQGDQMGAPRLRIWSPKGPRNGKVEKVTNTEAPKVEKMKNHKMKGLKSDIVDISFI